ncbi:MAG: vitamin K epoxide reductase family protein [Patescibacteria group bacterium]
MTQHQRVIWARRIMFWFAMIGLFAASYLLYTYTTGTELKCGIVHGCDVVRNSQWASLFGIPTPAFGVLFYAALIILSAYRAYALHKNVQYVRWLIVLMAVAGFAESLFLTGIEAFVLHAYCLWCLISAAASTGIFIFAWFDKKMEFGIETSGKELKVVFASLLVGLIAGGIGMYYLLKTNAPQIVDLTIGQQTASDGQLTTGADEPAEGVDGGFLVVATSTPIEGPVDAKVTLVEFFDFQCPACGVYHKLVILPLREKYKGKIQFAPRNFPLVDLHPAAMGAAIAGVCAQRQNKFFEFYDLLYANQQKLARTDLENYAKSISLDVTAFDACLDDPSAQHQVLYDYNAGRSFGISGTPTLILNNALIDGAPNLDTLSQLIDERL